MNDLGFNAYQNAAMRTAAITIGDKALLNAALGLAGEGGEFAEKVKKYFFHGHPLEPAKLAKELGDVLWYVALGAQVLGYDLVEIAELNITKLMLRYPEGFSSKRSVERAPEPEGFSSKRSVERTPEREA